MAVNRFMKPAEQPLLNTYVKLPFQEMSLAYNTIQKEHDAGEKLNNSLDDDILKVRASTPLHTSVLAEIRGGLDKELSALYDKHGGRYADMVPELTKIKKSLDQDFNDGSLFAIKETTKRKEKNLDKDIQKARSKGNYSEVYNPLFGGERDWYDFYHHGYKRDEEGWSIDEDSQDGWTTTPDGRMILTPYTYKGIHKPSDQLAEANTKIFAPIHEDYSKWIHENPDTGLTQMKEMKAITRQKVYKSAYENWTYLPDNMKMEIQAEVGGMGEKELLGAATHAINAVFGDPVAGTPGAEAKEKTLEAIKNNPAVARQWAAADYVGYMGEKFTFGSESESTTFDNAQFNKNKYPIDKSDWVVKIGDISTIQAGTVRTPFADGNELISDLSDPIDKYINIVEDNALAYEDVVREYENTKANYTLNDPYHEEWAKKIDNAKFAYEQSSMALIGLTQQAAKDMSVLETAEGIKYMDSNGRYVYVDRVLANGQINPDWNMHGWNSVQFDANGDVLNIEDVNRDAKTPQDNIYKYMDAAKGLFSSMASLGGTSSSPLMERVNTIQSNSGFFDGRSTQAPTLSSTGSKRVDAEIVKKLPSLLGQADTKFTTTDGKMVKWSDIVGTGSDKISQVTMKAFVDGDFSDNFQWLTEPTPDGKYIGILTLPSADGTSTVDLLFDAPEEVRRTWRNQGEYERPIGDGSGMTEMVTLPRTESQKQNWDANERGQIDFQRTNQSAAGNVGMSSAEDGENNPLGYYYFNQLPNGDPIQNESYVFQPRAGLLKNIVNGQEIYTDGTELYNVDSDMQDIGMLITLNDPQYAGAKAFYGNEFKTNPNPIAREGIPVKVESEARGIDISGEFFSTNLKPGQIMLPERRITQTQMTAYNTQNGWTFNSGFEGLNKQTADILAHQSKAFGDEHFNTLSSKITGKFNGSTVTMNDGSTSDFNTLLNNGDLELVPVSNVDGKFSLPLISGARSYAQQETMYKEWVDGGKVGDPVADPKNGGFHVMGQAVDLARGDNYYDYILVDNTGNIASIGTNTSGTHSIVSGYNQTGSSKSGFRVSELTDAGGTMLFPDYMKSTLTSLFDHLGTTPQAVKDMHKEYGNYKEADPLPDMKQFDKEWWHWSLGELTGASSGYVYPSWAN